jgi:D-alanine-D-alanine ligase
LECRDAGRVDLRLAADGTPHFLEVNPLAGLHPEHSDLPIICNLAGIPYQTLIEAIVTQTLERARTTPKVPDFDRPAAKTGAGTVPA